MKWLHACTVTNHAGRDMAAFTDQFGYPGFHDFAQCLAKLGGVRMPLACSDRRALRVLSANNIPSQADLLPANGRWIGN